MQSLRFRASHPIRFSLLCVGIDLIHSVLSSCRPVPVNRTSIRVVNATQKPIHHFLPSFIRSFVRPYVQATCNIPLARHSFVYPSAVIIAALYQVWLCKYRYTHPKSRHMTPVSVFIVFEAKLLSGSSSIKFGVPFLSSSCPDPSDRSDNRTYIDCPSEFLEIHGRLLHPMTMLSCQGFSTPFV